MATLLFIVLIPLFYSLYTGYRNCFSFAIRLTLYSGKTRSHYSLGLSKHSFIGQSEEGRKYLIDTITLGFLVFAIQVDFYKAVPTETDSIPPLRESNS